MLPLQAEYDPLLRDAVGNEMCWPTQNLLLTQLLVEEGLPLPLGVEHGNDNLQPIPIPNFCLCC